MYRKISFAMATFGTFNQKKRTELSSREIENLNTEKDYYNDLPGKLPPELLDPVEDIPPQHHSQPPRKLTIQVSTELIGIF